jgi:hypothetical protein
MPDMSDQLPLKAVLFEKDGRFYFFDPGFGVIASDITVEQAYGKFTELRAAHTCEIRRAGLGPLSSPSRAADIAPHQGVRQELGLFAAKFILALVIVAAVGLPIAASVARSVSAALSGAIASVQPISLADVVQKAADIARDAEELSPQKKEAMRQSIAVIKRELGPLFDAWSDPPNQRPPSGR